MSWPYITKEVANLGTTEVPDFQYVPKVIFIPGNGKGPWQTCRDCRETREEAHKPIRESHEAAMRLYGDHPDWTAPKAPEYPPVQVSFAVMGSGRCVKHILRFHKKQETLTPELEADVKRRDEVHASLRKGNYVAPV
jgi:hypothetical protein